VAFLRPSNPFRELTSFPGVALCPSPRPFPALPRSRTCCCSSSAYAGFPVCNILVNNRRPGGLHADSAVSPPQTLSNPLTWSVVDAAGPPLGLFPRPRPSSAGSALCVRSRPVASGCIRLPNYRPATQGTVPGPRLWQGCPPASRVEWKVSACVIPLHTALWRDDLAALATPLCRARGMLDGSGLGRSRHVLAAPSAGVAPPTAASRPSIAFPAGGYVCPRPPYGTVAGTSPPRGSCNFQRAAGRTFLHGRLDRLSSVVPLASASLRPLWLLLSLWNPFLLLRHSRRWSLRGPAGAYARFYRAPLRLRPPLPVPPCAPRVCPRCCPVVAGVAVGSAPAATAELLARSLAPAPPPGFLVGFFRLSALANHHCLALRRCKRLPMVRKVVTFLLFGALITRVVQSFSKCALAALFAAVVPR